jgi:hypothetical protein
MRYIKLCAFGYISYITIGIVIFIINTVVTQRKITNFLEFLWIPNLFLFGGVILIGTFLFLSSKNPGYSKIVLMILSLLLTIVQMFCLFMISFALAMFVIAPILHRLGFHVTMP